MKNPEAKTHSLVSSGGPRVQTGPTRAEAGPAPDREVQGEIDRIVEAAVYLYTESRRVTKRLARRHGLTGPQITALKVLEGFGSLSLSELGQRMSAKRSTITGIVDRMERDGLVLRRRSTTDRRVVHLEATARGAEIAAAVPVTAMQMFGGALRALPNSDRAELIRILGRVADHVRETAAAQDPDRDLDQRTRP